MRYIRVADAKGSAGQSSLLLNFQCLYTYIPRVYLIQYVTGERMLDDRHRQIKIPVGNEKRSDIESIRVPRATRWEQKYISAYLGIDQFAQSRATQYSWRH
jgi:hypothetical protein